MADLGSLRLKFVGDKTDLDRTFTAIGVKANLVSSAIESGFKVAARAVVAFTKGSITAFDQQAKAESSLLTALKGRVDVQQRLIQQAGQLQGRTLFGDETIIQSQAFLASLNLTEQQINKVIDAATDLAAGTGNTLDNAVKNLAKTYSGLSGELGESIPQLRTLTAEQLKAGKGIDAVAKAFEGQAEAAAASDVKLTQVQNKIGDIQELIGRVFAPAVREASAGMLQALGDVEEFLSSQKVQDFAIDAGATVKAAFISAGTEIQLAWAKAEQVVAEAFNTFFTASAKLANSGIGGILFSDEAIAQSNRNLAEAASKLDNVNQRIEDLEKSGKRFRDVYADAKFDASLLKLQSRLGDLAGSGSGGSSGGGGGGSFKSAEDALLKWITANERAKLKIDEFAEAMGTYRAEVGFLAREFEILDPFNKISDADAIGKAESLAGGGIDTNDFTFGGTPPEEIDAGALAMERQAAAADKLAQNIGLASRAADVFGQSIAESNAQGVKGLKAYGKAALDTAKAVIAAEIKKGVIAAATRALDSVPFPANIILAGVAAGAAQALLTGLLGKIPAFGDGGVVTEPTLALIGEKGPEAVVPLGGGKGLNASVQVTGVTYGADWYWMGARSSQLGRLING